MDAYSSPSKRAKRAGITISLLAVLLMTYVLFRSFFSSDEGIQSYSESRFVSNMEQQIPEMMREYSIPGLSILIIKEQKQIWSKAFGYANVEKNQKLKFDALFRVESISKPVTSWGVMKLAEENLISLDDPIQGYLGEWALPGSEFNTSEVTIRRLLSHSAGMPLGTVGEE